MAQRPRRVGRLGPGGGRQGVAQISDQRARGAQRRRLAIEAEGRRRRAVLRAQRAFGGVRAKRPGRTAGQGKFHGRRLGVVRDQQLARAEAVEQLPRAPPERLFIAPLGGQRADVAGAGRDVGRGQAQPQRPPLAAQPDGGAGRRFARLQQRRLERRARRDHAHHAAPHQPARRAGVLQLFADRDPVALGHQFGQVLLDGAHRHPGQGRAQPAAHRLRGQRDVQRLGDQLGVLVEGLVEIAQAEEQDRAGMARLQIQILPPNRCDHVRILHATVYRCSRCKRNRSGSLSIVRVEAGLRRPGSDGSRGSRG